MADPVYIVCGGTGGHLAPGIATAQRFMEKGVRIELITSQKEIDSRLLQAYLQIPYKRARGSPFGLHPAILLRFIINSILGFFQSVSLMRRQRPSTVIAFGGYLSFSYVLAAWILNIPVVLHEANRLVGKSIRSLAILADRIYLPDGVRLKSAKPGCVMRMGMPLRREVQHIKKEIIRKRLGVPMHVKMVTVVGGSQGALALNQWVEQHFRQLAGDGIWLNLVSGPGKQTLAEREVLTSASGETVEVRTCSFHTALHELFSASDIVISRAGAGTIAELIHCLAPSILVPYPYAADQHQLANACDLEKRGGCIVKLQDEMEDLYREVLDLIYNDSLLAKMRKNLGHLDPTDVAEAISEDVMEHFMGSAATVQQGMRTG